MQKNNTQLMLANLLGILGSDGFATWCASSFRQSAELQANYPNAAAYEGYMRAVADGRVRLHTVSAMPLPSVAEMASALDEAVAANRGSGDPDADEDRRTFRNSPTLQSEFRAEAGYLAYRKAERAGRARRISSGQ